jgi:high-affinity Fe2+/Pb2+ permease
LIGNGGKIMTLFLLFAIVATVAVSCGLLHENEIAQWEQQQTEKVKRFIYEKRATK